MCRYLLRPPLADRRLRLWPADQVALELKSPWKDSTRWISMCADTFLQRFASLVPRPRTHQGLYRGGARASLGATPERGARAARRRATPPPQRNLLRAHEAWARAGHPRVPLRPPHAVSLVRGSSPRTTSRPSSTRRASSVCSAPRACLTSSSPSAGPAAHRHGTSTSATERGARNARRAPPRPSIAWLMQTRTFRSRNPGVVCPDNDRFGSRGSSVDSTAPQCGHTTAVLLLGREQTGQAAGMESREVVGWIGGGVGPRPPG